MDRTPSGSMHRLQCIKTFSIWFSLVSLRGCQVWRKHIFFRFFGCELRICRCYYDLHTAKAHTFSQFCKGGTPFKKNKHEETIFRMFWDLLRILANLRYGNAQHSKFAERTDRVSYRIFWSSNGLRVYPATQICSRWAGAGMMFWAFP